MIPLAEVLRRHWPAYERKFGARLLRSHRRAVAAIVRCRTPALGGQLFRCDCGQFLFAYHSCNHRACPQCGHADATAWLASLREMTSELPLRITAARIARAGPGLVDGEVTLAPVGQKWQ